jgi:hypothetical protein
MFSYGTSIDIQLRYIPKRARIIPLLVAGAYFVTIGAPTIFFLSAGSSVELSGSIRQASGTTRNHVSAVLEVL